MMRTPPTPRAFHNWEDTIYDDLDQADDSVENLDRAGLEAWTPSSATWTVWVPYQP
jgi:hypothetical protein